MSWGPTGGQQTQFCSCKLIHSNTTPNETSTCIGFTFGQEICYYTTLLKKICALYPKRSISRAIKEEMLLVLHSLRKIAHQTQPVSLIKVYNSFPSSSVNKQAVAATPESAQQPPVRPTVGEVLNTSWQTNMQHYCTLMSHSQEALPTN